MNIKSRVQMKLYEAKVKAREELDHVLGEHNVTVEQVRAYVNKHPKYSRSIRSLPHHHGISTASNFVAEVAIHINWGPP